MASYPASSQPCREIFPVSPQAFSPKNRFKKFLTLRFEKHTQSVQLKIKPVDDLSPLPSGKYKGKHGRGTMTTELFREYRSQPTRQLRDRIFNHHYKLATSIAHQFSLCCDEPLDDLIQLAAMGLMTAIERFDPERGNAFSSFACPYIKGEIRHYLRDKSNTVKIPRSFQSLYQQGRKLQNESVEKGIVLNDKQTAIALDVTEEKWREAKSACSNRLPYNIDTMLGMTNEDEWTEEGVTRQLSVGRVLSMSIELSNYDKVDKQPKAIEALPLSKLDQPDQMLLSIFFLENKSLKELRQSARASGIKAKDIKPMLVKAVLNLTA